MQKRDLPRGIGRSRAVRESSQAPLWKVVLPVPLRSLRRDDDCRGALVARCGENAAQHLADRVRRTRGARAPGRLGRARGVRRLGGFGRLRAVGGFGRLERVMECDRVGTLLALGIGDGRFELTFSVVGNGDGCRIGCVVVGHSLLVALDLGDCKRVRAGLVERQLVERDIAVLIVLDRLVDTVRIAFALERKAELAVFEAASIERLGCCDLDACGGGFVYVNERCNVRAFECVRYGERAVAVVGDRRYDGVCGAAVGHAACPRPFRAACTCACRACRT